MMLKRTVDERKKKKKKTNKKKKKGIDVDGKMATISTVKVMLEGERVFSRHAMKSFETIESQDGNIERAFGERRLRKLYGRRVVKSEKKKGTTMVEVHIDRVQAYSDADEESDVVVVGCVDAPSTGLPNLKIPWSFETKCVCAWTRTTSSKAFIILSCLFSSIV